MKTSSSSSIANTTTTQQKQERDDDPHLENLLSKLRPFQREAFEFATKGASYSRQFSNNNGSENDTNHTTTKTKNSATTKTPSSKFKRKKNDNNNNNNNNAIAPTSSGGNGRLLLADEMGLGKTVTSLAIMTSFRKEWPLLILCPASLRHTWPAEIEKFLPWLPISSIYVVSGFDDIDFITNPNKRKQIQIVIVTYSLLQTRSAVAQALTKNEQINYFQCIIVDESHNIKERTSQRCKLIMPLLIKSKRLILLSGTPALARPVELWTQVHCIEPKLFGAYTPYTKRYCNAKRGRFGWDVKGISNATELHTKLRQIMIRRLKNDVLHELPPKQRTIVTIKIDNPTKAKECRELIEDLNATKQSSSDFNLNDNDNYMDASQAYFEHRKLLMQAYQASGILKANSVAEYVLDWLAGSLTQKVLVFAHHQDVMDTLENAISKKYKGVGHIRIDGTVPATERAKRVRKFQTNSKVRVAILSITAAGVGLTLTAASTVIFAELHWTPGILAQAEDRCHRIGQVNAVHVIYCICKDQSISVDTTLWSMLARKVGTLGRVIDGSTSASMDAEYDDSADNATNSRSSSTKNNNSISAEDELSRFFADTSVNNDNKKKPSKIPAKGSILSFFKPTTATKTTTTTTANAITSNPSPNKTTTTNETSETTATAASSTIDDKNCSSPISKATTKIATAIEDDNDHSRLENKHWSCPSCTFHNKLSRNFCEMCMTKKKKKTNKINDNDISKLSVEKGNQTNDILPMSSSSLVLSPESLSLNTATKNKESIHNVEENDIVITTKISSPEATSTGQTITTTRVVEEETPIIDLTDEIHINDDIPCRKNSRKRSRSNILSSCNVRQDRIQESTITNATSPLPRHPQSIHSNDVTENKNDNKSNVVNDKDDTNNKSCQQATLFATTASDMEAEKYEGGAQQQQQYVVTPGQKERQPKKKSKTLQTVMNSPTNKPTIDDSLQFVVSKNSGRISLYNGTTGNSLHINFDINQVLTEETRDIILDGSIAATSKNTSIGPSSLLLHRNIHFCDTALQQLINSLPLVASEKLDDEKRRLVEQCSFEIRSFVTSYITLREVEKKALKTWSLPVSSRNLKQAVSRIMSSSMSVCSSGGSNSGTATGYTPCTERYIGGAKERAITKKKAGLKLSPEENAVLTGTACAWCGKTMPDICLINGVKSTYCSQECVENGRIKRGGMYASTQIRAQVFGLEGGVCRNCGIDAHALFLHISSMEPCERLNALLSANWQLPKNTSALEKLLHNPKEGDFWQADHVTPVAEGGGGCGLENLQTLCTPCHRVETEKLRSRLRLTNAISTKVDENNNHNASGSNRRTGGKQMDIRAAFSQTNN